MAERVGDDRHIARGASRILPDFEDDLLLELFHRGARAQWTSRDLDLDRPLRLAPRQREALAHLLTPVYFGEQTAMAGASSILPDLIRARETTAQLYVASFIMDEARHFEALTQVYRVLGHDPLGLRDIPELLRYHHRIRQGDRADWVWGILFSDVIAKHFYRAFGLGGSDPLFAGVSTRILQDESRHLAFAEHYLRRNVARMDRARRRSMLGMRDDLFRLLQSMTERVRADAGVLGVDADDYLGRVWGDVETFARRIGLADVGPGGDPGAGQRPGDAPRASLLGAPGPEAREVSPDSAAIARARRTGQATRADTSLGRAREGGLSSRWEPSPEHEPEHEGVSLGEGGSLPEGRSLAECFGCVLSWLCRRRLAPA